MIDIETLTRLKTMRLSGMAEYFENLADATGVGKLTGPEMVKQAVDWEYVRRRDSKLHRLRRQAGLAQSDADIADIKAMPGRDVDTELISRLAIGSYLVKHQDVVLQGPTGAGKTYVACALNRPESTGEFALTWRIGTCQFRGSTTMRRGPVRSDCMSSAASRIRRSRRSRRGGTLAA